MSQSIQAIAPNLAVVDGTPTTTSNEVALTFHKRHADLLRAIEALKADCPAEFTERNFALSEFTDSTGRTLPAYRLTRDGFTLLAMGFTGKKALAFKLAYIDAFNRMESALKSSAAPALSYTRISPAQAQDLKELVQAIVAAKVQGFAETWARLHKKFRVNSYLELPATRFEEARDYLLGKLPEPPEPPAPSFKNRRWMIDVDNMGNEVIKPIDWDDCLLKYRDLPRLIKDPSNPISANLVASIGQACIERLHTKLDNQQPRQYIGGQA